MLKVLRQECVWVAINLCGIVFYVVKTWSFTTIEWAIAPMPFEWLNTVAPILGTFFLLNLIWTAFVIVGIAKLRGTLKNLLVVSLVGILWIGTYVSVDYRITCAEKEAQKY